MHQDRRSIVIGGGFFGLYMAEYLSSRYDHVVVCERHQDVMQRASWGNQARVHNGYHYPRSLLTAFRSRVNYPRFCDEFADCIDDSFENTYAIARGFTKVNAEQFRVFMGRIGAKIERAGAETRQLFDPQYIEDIFLTQESVFHSGRLKEVMLNRLRAKGVEVRLATEVVSLRSSGDGIEATTSGDDGEAQLHADIVFNCTYSGINGLTRGSGLPVIPLKHELAEMCLVEVPEPVRCRSITVMCGPFFSCMPFPPKGLHSLSHVRYTPCCTWHDSSVARNGSAAHDSHCKISSFPHMIRDAQRYVPILADCRYRESIWETKTVLPLSEVDDSRPILFKPHYGMPNHHVVLGGKIDNVYDVVHEVDRLLSC